MWVPVHKAQQSFFASCNTLPKYTGYLILLKFSNIFLYIKCHYFGLDLASFFLVTIRHFRASYPIVMCWSCLVPENEQKASSIKDQTQQVQWIRAIGSILPVLLHLGLQHLDRGKNTSLYLVALDLHIICFSFHLLFFYRRTLQKIPLTYGKVTHTLTWCT